MYRIVILFLSLSSVAGATEIRRTAELELPSGLLAKLSQELHKEFPKQMSGKIECRYDLRDENFTCTLDSKKYRFSESLSTELGKVLESESNAFFSRMGVRKFTVTFTKNIQDQEFKMIQFAPHVDLNCEGSYTSKDVLYESAIQLTFDSFSGEGNSRNFWVTILGQSVVNTDKGTVKSSLGKSISEHRYRGTVNVDSSSRNKIKPYYFKAELEPLSAHMSLISDGEEWKMRLWNMNRSIFMDMDCDLTGTY